MNKLLEKQSKGLSPKEQKKLDKLQSKLKSNKRINKKIDKLQKKQANGLSKREQEKLDMLLTRNEYKLSQNEYKHFINNETPAMKAVNNYRDLAKEQEDAFRLAKAQKLAAIDKDIAYRKEYLERGKNVIPEQNQKAIKEDINHLIAYRNSVDDVQNISQDINRKNIGDIEQSLIDKPRNWLDNELDIEQTTFQEMAQTSGVQEPTLKIDTQTLIENEPELLRRVEALKQSKTQQSTKQDVNETKDNSNNDKSAIENNQQRQINNQTTKQDDDTTLTL